MTQRSPNPQQQQAIHTTEGPLLIIAGPGSGKTFTLVERIYHLIAEKGVEPEHLFVSTFTEKAAAELITRVSDRVASDNFAVNLNEMYLGTFHSICLRFLKEYRDFTRLKRNFTLMDPFDQQYFLYQRLAEYQKIEGNELLLGKPNTSWWFRAQRLASWLNKVGEEALHLERLVAAPEAEVQVLGRLYLRYQEHLTEANALDFSTIQVEALRLLEGRPEVLDAIRRKIRYLMIDEYQDTNTIQELILFKLTEPHCNVCVVGDDDQGLYRFRGATVRNILEFPQKFPPGDCKQITLETNYRSEPAIIDFYNRWMDSLNWTEDGITFRFRKKIAAPLGKRPSAVPAVVKVSTDREAADWHDEVLAFLNGLKGSGALTDWNQVAFLFRSVKNDRVIALAEALESNGIPVYSPRSNLFFLREEIRLMIGALIYLFPQFEQVRKWSQEASLEIWKYYDDDCFVAFATELRKPEHAPLKQWCNQRRRAHLALTKGADYAFSGLFYDLLQFPLFSRYLGDESEGGVIDSRPARNLAILSQLLAKFEYLHQIRILTPEHLERDIQRLFNRFLRFLKEGAIDEYEDRSEYAPSGCVSFLTIHQAKGLEFPVVVVGSLEATPWRQQTDLEELLQRRYYRKRPFEPTDRVKHYDFWRLFYTAFSRAQNLLVLTCQEKARYPKTPSKYFQDEFDRLVSWRDPSFQAERLELETIRDTDLKASYSFTSHILLFENCARQYKFYRHLDFSPVRRNPILFGTLVHHTIEDIHKAVLRGEEHIVTDDWIAHTFTHNYHHLSQQEHLYLGPGSLESALDHVLRYVHRERGTWDRLRETEVEVSLVKEDYILKGHVDLIRGEHDTVELVDFKSEKKPDLYAEREKYERYRRQLEIYAHIIEGRTAHKVSKMHLYYTGEDSGNPYVSFDKNATSVHRTISAFDDVVARIERKDFAISERPEKLCKNCDLKAYCDAL